MKTKKIMAALIACMMMLGMTACSDDDSSSAKEKSAGDSSVTSAADDSGESEPDADSEAESSKDESSDADSSGDESSDSEPATIPDSDTDSDVQAGSSPTGTSSTADPDTSKPDTSKPDTTKPDLTPSDFKEVVLVDNSDCLMKVTGIEPNGSFGSYAVKVKFENRTSDKELIFEWQDTAINHYLISSFLSQRVKAGESAEAEANFFKSDIEKYGIKNVALVTGNYRVFDPASYFNDLYTGEVKLTPAGESAKVEKSYTPDGKTVFDKENCKTVVLGIEDSEGIGTQLDLYLENNYGKQVYFVLDNFKINGVEGVFPRTSLRIANDSMSLSNVKFTKNKLTDNGIVSVSKVEFDLNISATADGKKPIATEHVVLNF